MRLEDRWHYSSCLVACLCSITFGCYAAKGEEVANLVGLFRSRDAFVRLMNFNKFNETVSREERPKVLANLIEDGRSSTGDAAHRLCLGILGYLLQHGAKEVTWTDSLRTSVLPLVVHPNVQVRASAFNVLYRHYPERFEARATMALFDESEGVSGIAVTQITKRSENAKVILGFYVKRSVARSDKKDSLLSVRSAKRWLEAQKEQRDRGVKGLRK